MTATQGIGLARGEFDRAFPFHFVVDGELRVLQVGPAFRQAFPDLPVGSVASEALQLRRPHRPFNPAGLASLVDDPILLLHRATDIRLRGEFLAVAGGAFAFLGSPWFDTAEELASSGLSLSAYALHDPVVELLMIGQTQRISMRDLRDLAGRLQVQREATRRNERTYREAIAAADAVAYREGAAGDRYEFVDGGIVALTGYAPDEITPAVFRRLIVETRAAAENGSGTTGRRVEHRLLARDGVERWIAEASVEVLDADGSPAGTVGILQDVTERVHHEAELLRLGSERDAILSVSPDGFAAFGADGRLSYCNPAFERLIGTADGGLVGTEFAAVDAAFARLAPASVPAPLVAIDDQQGDEIRTQSARILTRQVRHIPDPERTGAGRVLIVRDVTREREVERLKSEFLATAAHELRTPMTSVLGFAELLLTEDYDRLTARDIAGTIHRQCHQLVRTVNDLLDLARIEAGRGLHFELNPVALDAVMRNVVAGLKIPGDDREVTLEACAGQPPVVVADERQLSHALGNVLSNAYKYSPQGGEIRVGTRRRRDASGPQAAIVVRDHGLGMSPEQLARMFERFFRADPSGTIPGTGLGMSLVKEIVELHGGVVEVDSAPGEGTTVALWLPEAVNYSGPAA